MASQRPHTRPFDSTLDAMSESCGSLSMNWHIALKGGAGGVVKESSKSHVSFRLVTGELQMLEPASLL